MAVPKYRYYLVPPETIRITPEDFLAGLPAGAWTGHDRTRDLAVSCDEVLDRNFPRIRFERLRELMPDCIQHVAGAPEWIALRTDRIVLAYRPETRREELPPEPKAGEPAKDEEKTKEPAAAPDPTPAAESPEAPANPAAPAPKPIPAWKRILKPKLATPPPQPAEPEAKEPPKPALAARALPAEDEAVLRGLLMTDDELTVGRVLDLCAKLPGVNGCELLIGDKVEHAATMPANIKPSAWIAPAREALAKMEGIPAARPVLTLHPEGLGLSMWLPAKFTLLVAHDERGFPPGVREKIAAAAAAIEKVAD